MIETSPLLAHTGEIGEGYFGVMAQQRNEESVAPVALVAVEIEPGSSLARWNAALEQARLRSPKHCPRCGSVNIVPNFTVLAAWDCLGCDRSFCPE